MTMTDLTTIVAELREIDLDELASVEGGYDDGSPWCGFHPPGWRPGLPG
jgi:hypothetical protein